MPFTSRKKRKLTQAIKGRRQKKNVFLGGGHNKIEDKAVVVNFFASNPYNGIIIDQFKNLKFFQQNHTKVYNGLAKSQLDSLENSKAGHNAQF